MSIKPSAYSLIYCATVASFGLAAPVDAQSLLTSYKVSDNTNFVASSDADERYVIKIRSSALKAMTLEAIAKNFSLSGYGAVHRTLTKQQLIAITLNKKTLNLLRAHPFVETVERDEKRYLKAQTEPYGIPMVQANQVNQADTSAKKVCVIDSGYNLGHPDLPDENDGLSGESNNFAVGSWSRDGNGHGTHVAGTIAALDNQEGVVGVYPGVNLHIVKIFNDLGQWTFASDLIDGINQCQQAGADIVNMSLGGSGSSQSEANAMQQFYDEGLLLVAAAGNDGNSSKSYPASYDAVVSVAALNSNQTVADYSQFNNQVELAAPGTSVLSTYPSSRYASLSGTSMASPHVAGAMALVWSFYPSCTANEIRAVMATSAKDLGAPGRDVNYGYGLIQIKDAITSLANDGCANTAEPVTPPTPPAPPIEEVKSEDVTVTNLNGDRGSWQRFEITIPANTSSFEVSIEGGSGDADLYVNQGTQTSTRTWDCRPYRYGNNEVCRFSNPIEGTWHIGVRGYNDYSGVTLNYKYQ